MNDRRNFLRTPAAVVFGAAMVSRARAAAVPHPPSTTPPDTAAPPPPPNVPPLEESDRSNPTSLRERMERHRRSPVCASCHSKMDPLGFAMEHFDAIGRWRESDGGAPINATIEWGGATVDSPRAFREALLASGDEFVRTVTEKLLTYAIGRGLDYPDAPTVRAIVRDLKRDDLRWSSLVRAVVASDPFQMRRGPTPEPSV